MTQKGKERDYLIISPPDYDESLLRGGLRHSGCGMKTCEVKAALLTFVCFAPQKCTSKTPGCTKKKRSFFFFHLLPRLQLSGSNGAVKK